MIALGDTEISNIKLGDISINSIYIGDVKVWPTSLISYITIDQTATDPATMILGEINGTAIRWICSNTHRVLGKYTAEGIVSYCQLLDTDSTKYYDGTTADLTGGEGDVFVKLPTFYYKANELSTDVWQIGFARSKPDDTWKTWDGNDLIGA